MKHLLPSFIALWNSKKNLTRGSRPPTAPYSFAGPKEYAEKGLRCAGHVWFDLPGTSSQIILIDKQSTLPPQEPRLLRASPVVEDCKCCFAF
jgi:hypothetical protein